MVWFAEATRNPHVFCSPYRRMRMTRNTLRRCTCRCHRGTRCMTPGSRRRIRSRHRRMSEELKTVAEGTRENTLHRTHSRGLSHVKPAPMSTAPALRRADIVMSYAGDAAAQGESITNLPTVKLSAAPSDELEAVPPV